MTVLPLITNATNYQTPSFVNVVISEKKKDEKGTNEDNKYKEKVPEPDYEEKNTTTSLLTDLGTFEELPTIPEHLYKEIKNSKSFRKRQIAAKLKETIPLFDKLEEQLNSSSAVLTVVKINKILEQTWDNIGAEDEDIALTISALEKLISGNFWKKFQTETIKKIKTILNTYINSSDESAFEALSMLIKDNKIDILPQIPDE